MPAKSEKQRRLMAIAEHNPEMLHKKNRGVLKMSKKQLSEYASTKENKMKKAPKNKKAAKGKNAFFGNSLPFQLGENSRWFKDDRGMGKMSFMSGKK